MIHFDSKNCDVTRRLAEEIGKRNIVTNAGFSGSSLSELPSSEYCLGYKSMALARSYAAKPSASLHMSFLCSYWRLEGLVGRLISWSDREDLRDLTVVESHNPFHYLLLRYW